MTGYGNRVPRRPQLLAISASCVSAGYSLTAFASSFRLVCAGAETGARTVRDHGTTTMYAHLFVKDRWIRYPDRIQE